MKKIRIANSAVAFCAGFFIIIFFIIAGGGLSAETLFEFFIKPFSSVWHLGNMLDKMRLLLFAASGSLFALKCGCLNLGGDGQIYLAGVLSSLFLQKLWGIFSPLQFALALLLTVLISSFSGIVLGFLHLKFKADILLTSFLLFAGITPVLDHLITNPLRDKAGNLIAMPPILEQFNIKEIMPPSSFNISFFIALLFAGGFILFFAKTKYGYRLDISGRAGEFARFAGFSAAAPSIAGMAVSAGMHGLAGFFAITGTWHMCHLGFSSGMGRAALAVALIAKNNFKAVIPAAFLYAWIQSTSDALVMSGRSSSDTSVFLQAAIFLFISAEIFNIKFIKTKKRRVC